ncbi:hypothetical protein VTH06DRAFT_3310 [Thermothelomyces fergusii]
MSAEAVSAYTHGGVVVLVLSFSVGLSLIVTVRTRESSRLDLMLSASSLLVRPRQQMPTSNGMAQLFPMNRETHHRVRAAVRCFDAIRRGAPGAGHERRTRMRRPVGDTASRFAGPLSPKCEKARTEERYHITNLCTTNTNRAPTTQQLHVFPQERTGGKKKGTLTYRKTNIAVPTKSRDRRSSRHRREKRSGPCSPVDRTPARNRLDLRADSPSAI